VAEEALEIAEYLRRAIARGVDPIDDVGTRQSEVPLRNAFRLVRQKGFGFVTEWRAVRSMEALRQFAQVTCIVLRDGSARTVGAEELVPGDVVLLDAGDVVPADLRLVEAAKLNADESTLTGESLPVRKHIEPLDMKTPVLDRENIAIYIHQLAMDAHGDLYTASVYPEHAGEKRGPEGPSHRRWTREALA